MPNISSILNVVLTIEAPNDENTTTLNLTETDATCTDSEYATMTIPIATIVDIGSTTPSTLIGRIVTGQELVIQTDVPVSMTMQTATETSVFTFNGTFAITGNIRKVSLEAFSQAAHVKIAVAGVLS